MVSFSPFYVVFRT